MSFGEVDSKPRRLLRYHALFLFCFIFVSGCGARQKAEEDLAICKSAVKNCEFTRESLRDQVKQCRASASTATPIVQDPSLDEWRAGFHAVTLKTAAMFRNYTYSLEIVRGALVFSLPINTLFKENKSSLTSQGREVVARLSQIIKAFGDRQFMITCRSVENQVGNFNKAVTADQTLSLKRSGAIVSKLGRLGIDQRSVRAAGYAGQPENPVGRFEFAIYPLPHELPAFPTDFLPESSGRSSTSGQYDSSQQGW